MGINRQKTVSVAKVLVGGLCSAEDVLSESVSAGTAWEFVGVGGGYIVKAQAICETTALTPRLTLFLFKDTPTSNLNDNVANTAMLHADLANYLGKIDFPAMEDLGTGCSDTVATPSTYGNLPLAVSCKDKTGSIFGILVARDAVTPAASADMTVKLVVEQY